MESDDYTEEGAYLKASANSALNSGRKRTMIRFFLKQQARERREAKAQRTQRDKEYALLLERRAKAAAQRQARRAAHMRHKQHSADAWARATRKPGPVQGQILPLTPQELSLATAAFIAEAQQKDRGGPEGVQVDWGTGNVGTTGRRLYGMAAVRGALTRLGVFLGSDEVMQLIRQRSAAVPERLNLPTSPGSIDQTASPSPPPSSRQSAPAVSNFGLMPASLSLRSSSSARKEKRKKRVVAGTAERDKERERVAELRAAAASPGSMTPYDSGWFGSSGDFDIDVDFAGFSWMLSVLKARSRAQQTSVMDAGLLAAYAGLGGDAKDLSSLGVNAHSLHSFMRELGVRFDEKARVTKDGDIEDFDYDREGESVPAESDDGREQQLLPAEGAALPEAAPELTAAAHSIPMVIVQRPFASDRIRRKLRGAVFAVRAVRRLARRHIPWFLDAGYGRTLPSTRATDGIRRHRKEFIAAKRWEGRIHGYYFTRGIYGQGYYPFRLPLPSLHDPRLAEQDRRQSALIIETDSDSEDDDGSSTQSPCSPARIPGSPSIVSGATMRVLRQLRRRHKRGKQLLQDALSKGVKATRARLLAEAEGATVNIRTGNAGGLAVGGKGRQRTPSWRPAKELGARPESNPSTPAQGALRLSVVIEEPRRELRGLDEGSGQSGSPLIQQVTEEVGFASPEEIQRQERESEAFPGSRQESLWADDGEDGGDEGPDGWSVPKQVVENDENPPLSQFFNEKRQREYAKRVAAGETHPLRTNFKELAEDAMRQTGFQETESDGEASPHHAEPELASPRQALFRQFDEHRRRLSLRWQVATMYSGWEGAKWLWPARGPDGPGAERIDHAAAATEQTARELEERALRAERRVSGLLRHAVLDIVARKRVDKLSALWHRDAGRIDNLPPEEREELITRRLQEPGWLSWRQSCIEMEHMVSDQGSRTYSDRLGELDDLMLAISDCESDIGPRDPAQVEATAQQLAQLDGLRAPEGDLFVVLRGREQQEGELERISQLSDYPAGQVRYIKFEDFAAFFDKYRVYKAHDSVAHFHLTAARTSRVGRRQKKTRAQQTRERLVASLHRVSTQEQALQRRGSVAVYNSRMERITNPKLIAHLEGLIGSSSFSGLKRVRGQEKGADFAEQSAAARMGLLLQQNRALLKKQRAAAEAAAALEASVRAERAQAAVTWVAQQNLPRQDRRRECLLKPDRREVRQAARAKAGDEAERAAGETTDCGSSTVQKPPTEPDEDAEAPPAHCGSSGVMLVTPSGGIVTPWRGMKYKHTPRRTSTGEFVRGSARLAQLDWRAVEQEIAELAQGARPPDGARGIALRAAMRDYDLRQHFPRLGEDSADEDSSDDLFQLGSTRSPKSPISPSLLKSPGGPQEGGGLKSPVAPPAASPKATSPGSTQKQQPGAAKPPDRLKKRMFAHLVDEAAKRERNYRRKYEPGWQGGFSDSESASAADRDAALESCDSHGSSDSSSPESRHRARLAARAEAALSVRSAGGGDSLPPVVIQTPGTAGPEWPPSPPGVSTPVSTGPALLGGMSGNKQTMSIAAKLLVAAQPRRMLRQEHVRNAAAKEQGFLVLRNRPVLLPIDILRGSDEARDALEAIRRIPLPVRVRRSQRAEQRRAAAAARRDEAERLQKLGLQAKGGQSSASQGTFWSMRQGSKVSSARRSSKAPDASSAPPPPVPPGKAPPLPTAPSPARDGDAEVTNIMQGWGSTATEMQQDFASPTGSSSGSGTPTQEPFTLSACQEPGPVPLRAVLSNKKLTDLKQGGGETSLKERVAARRASIPAKRSASPAPARRSPTLVDHARGRPTTATPTPGSGMSPVPPNPLRSITPLPPAAGEWRRRPSHPAAAVTFSGSPRTAGYPKVPVPPAGDRPTQRSRMR